MAWAFGAVCAAALLAYTFAPKPDLYAHTSFSTLAMDRHGKPLQLTPAADGRYRLFTPLADIAPAAIEATLLYEDRDFHNHAGVSLEALARAAWTTYVRRERRVGGSTITMQLARLRFRFATRTPLGKLRQVVQALQIERHYDKEEILEAYLNLAPYGGAIEGLGTASRIYFDKPAAALNLGEALALAVIPQNPVARFPAAPGGREALLAARERLLGSWRRRADIAEDESTTTATSLLALTPRFRSPTALPRRAPHFVRDHLPPTGKARVRTTLDLSLQTMMETRLRDHVQRHRRDGIHNAAALLLDHRAAQVLALAGSAAFLDAAIAGQVNGVTARRAPGSTLKPLLYGLALEAGLLHPMSLLKDAPRRFAGFTPENFDRGFLGPVFARDALIHSRNVPTVTTLARFGVGRFRDWLAQAGVARLRPADDYGLALALGGAEVTMIELARLYAMLATGGQLRNMNTVLGQESPAAPARLMSAEAAFLTLDALFDVPRPGVPGLFPDRQPAVAWKTGTSFGFRDAWSIGVFDRYTLAVWVGNFDGSPNPAFVGRTAAAPLFFGIADSLPRSVLQPQRPAPAPTLNLRRVAVCAPTGDLPGPHCPRTARSWFIPGVSPIKVSTVHRAVRVDEATGLRVCRGRDDGVREEIFEFWPSDLEAVFRRAGIVLRRPPPWAPGCAMDSLATTRQAPRIRSPESTLTYYAPTLDSSKADEVPRQILFSATTDADARRLFWFVDDRLVAEVGRGQPHFWTPRPGTFTVRAVDDAGGAAAVAINVLPLSAVEAATQPSTARREPLQVQIGHRHEPVAEHVHSCLRLLQDDIAEEGYRLLSRRGLRHHVYEDHLVGYRAETFDLDLDGPARFALDDILIG